MEPSFLFTRLAATLVATAAMSASPLMRAEDTTWLSASTTAEASTLSSWAAASLSAISLAAPTPVGPERTMKSGSS